MNIKQNLTAIHNFLLLAHQTSNKLLASLDSAAPEAISQLLDKMLVQLERGVVEARNLCEISRPTTLPERGKPPLPDINIAGRTEIDRYGWLHIELSTLLPNCRFQTPAYLTDTIIRLLDEYESSGRILPRFEDAILIIDEHCNIKSRQVFDQDNKSWKAIPNALKGRIVRDDDQFSLHLALLSTISDKPVCHIYLLPQAEAGEFFMLRNDGFL